MYSNGYGVEQDYEEAAYWLYQAAMYGGNLWAGYDLAKLYIEGKGVEQDHEEARNILLWVAANASGTLLENAQAALDAM
jgi:hypothetical protein